ncbi:hypothetical protein MUNTM_26340 [Mycobacterium sp. MUNTM1]
MKKTGKHGFTITGFMILLAISSPNVFASSAPTPGPPLSTTAPSTPSGCYPLSKKGNCYEPGQFCRSSDHGASGVSGDGKDIICASNDGWRWEPAS